MISPEDSREIIGRGQKVSLSCLPYAATHLRKMPDTEFTFRLTKGDGLFLLTVGLEKRVVLVVDEVKLFTKQFLHKYIGDKVVKDDGACLRKSGTAYLEAKIVQRETNLKSRVNNQVTYPREMYNADQCCFLPILLTSSKCSGVEG